MRQIASRSEQLGCVAPWPKDVIRVGVGLLDRVEHRLWIGRSSHGFSFLIDPVVDVWTIRRTSSSSWITFAVFCSLKIASSNPSSSRCWSKLVLTPLGGIVTLPNKERDRALRHVSSQATATARTTCSSPRLGSFRCVLADVRWRWTS